MKYINESWCIYINLDVRNKSWYIVPFGQAYLPLPNVITYNIWRRGLKYLRCRRPKSLRHPNRFIVFLAAPNYTKQASNAYSKPSGTLLMCLETLSHWVPLSRAVKIPLPPPPPSMPYALPTLCQLYIDRCILNRKRERWTFFNFLRGGDILATKGTCLSRGVGNLNYTY